MSLSLLLLKKIVQLFLIGICGFTFVKLHLFDYKDSGFLSKLILYLITPCCLLNAFQTPFTREIGQNIIFATILSVGCMVVFLILGHGSRKLFHLPVVDEGSIVYTNIAYLNIPIVQYVFGNEWVIYVSIFVVIQSFFMWTHYVPMLSGERVNLKGFLLNPIIPACLVSLLLFLANIRLPEVLGETVSSLSITVGPLSMILIGISMANADIRKMISDKTLYLTTAICVIVTPLVVMAIFILLKVHDFAGGGLEISTICLLVAAAPSANMMVQFAVLYDNDAKRASAINVMTTLACVLTMPAMAALYLYFVE